ncbi:MAG TPA: phage major capsid protein [Pseudomonadales bacterium]|nr:phage major capsid protein [Pseudomonadales bacterium]
MMPFPNEHAARLRDPDRYQNFRRVNDEFGEGIDAIYGIIDNQSELQAIRFDKNLFTVQEAKQWLEDNDFEPILFEEAMEERKATAIVHRNAAMETEVVDERRVMMSISSEMPVERNFGVEVLDHAPESIDLSFLNSGRAPLLLDHDAERQIGVIESVNLDGSARRLRATVRFSKNALAQEIYSDVADNIRGNVSIGYSINKMVKEKDGRTYRATSWRPVEASIVSIPADTSVGVGRSLDDVVAELNQTEEPVMDTQETRAEAVVTEAVVTEAVEATPQVAEVVEVPAEETRAESAYPSIILIEEPKMEKTYDAPVQQDVGMSKQEVKRFSLMRAINALANPSDRTAQRAAAFEFECSEAAQRAFGQSAQGILVPAEILRQWNKRDLDTTNDAGLVGQQFRPDAFVDALRNASSVMQAGATMLTGLSGNIKIPKKSAASSGSWFTEGNAPSESEMTITSITMSPKTVGAYTDVTRNLMMQGSPDVEALVRNDLSQSLALAIDLGALSGSGSSGQPTGIKNTSGINTKDFAATNPTFAEVVGMETEVASDNALLGNLAYILTAAQYGALKTTSKDSGSGQFVVGPDGMLNGYRAIVSNQAAAGDVYFGNFSDLLIGMWGGLDILVDPYTASTTGTVRVVAMQSCDVAVRNAVSFCFGDADITP